MTSFVTKKHPILGKTAAMHGFELADFKSEIFSRCIIVDR